MRMQRRWVTQLQQNRPRWWQNEKVRTAGVLAAALAGVLLVIASVYWKPSDERLRELIECMNDLSDTPDWEDESQEDVYRECLRRREAGGYRRRRN